MPPGPSRTKACAACHERKVKCDVVEGAGACTNCRNSQTECVPHTRKPRGSKREHSSETLASPNSSKRSKEPPLVRIDSGSTAASDAQSHSGPATMVSFPDSVSQGPRTCGASEPLAPTPAPLRPYFAFGDYVVHEDLEPSPPPTRSEYQTLTDAQRDYLNNTRAFELPSRPVRDSLFAHFRERVLPWMPIFSKDELENLENAHSPPLLINSVLLAACSVSSMPGAMATGEILHMRATVLLHCDVEHNPVIVMKALCGMLWWTRRGPQDMTLDSAHSWRAKSICLAVQLGLHRSHHRFKSDKSIRRLWWFLVGHDNLVSACTARPRLVDVKCSDCAPLRYDDFDEHDHDAQSFLVHLSLYQTFGDLANRSLRGNLNRSYREGIQQKLMQWITDLPPSLHIYERRTRKLCPYNFAALQLHLFYLTALIVLFRPRGATSFLPPPAVVLASSFVSGILEEIMARGDVVRLHGAVLFTCFCAALCHISCKPYPNLRDEAERELNIINQMLHEYEKKTLGARFMQDWIEKMSNAPASASLHHKTPKEPEFVLPEEQRVLYAHFGPDMCGKWVLMGADRESEPDPEPPTRSQFSPGYMPSAPPAMAANYAALSGTDSSTSISPDRMLPNDPNMLWDTPWTDMIAQFDDGLPNVSAMDSWFLGDMGGTSQGFQ